MADLKVSERTSTACQHASAVVKHSALLKDCTLYALFWHSITAVAGSVLIDHCTLYAVKEIPVGLGLQQLCLTSLG